MVWKVGGAYEKTLTELTEKINDPNGFGVLVGENISDRNACYFCNRKIPTGHNMYEVVRNFVSCGEINQEKFFIDVNCMAEIRGKDK